MFTEITTRYTSTLSAKRYLLNAPKHSNTLITSLKTVILAVGFKVQVQVLMRVGNMFLQGTNLFITLSNGGEGFAY